MQAGLREGHRQQHAAPVHHGRTSGQCRENLLRELLPRGQALGRGGLPCPGVPAAAAPALHGIPAGAAVGPAGRTGVLLSGRFAALALALFTGGGCGVQPEQFFRGVLPCGRQGTGRARLDQPCHKVALAALTGPDAAHLAHVQRQASGAVGLALAAKGVVHIAQRVGQLEFRVPLQKGRHLPLVLFRRKGTGGIHQLPAGGQRGGGAVQDLCTQLSALLYQRFTVLLPGHRLLAEHSLAGTGGIHQHPVEKLRQGLRDAGRRLVEHHRVGHAHAFQVAFQDLGAGRHIFVAHQHAPPLQSRCQLAALAAGGRAQVQYPHAGLHSQQRGCRGRRRLLRVEHARVVVRVASGFELRRMHHKGRFAERRHFQREVRFLRKLLRHRAQG